MSYQYQTYDNFFDIESLQNLFLDSHYFPQTHHLEIFYLSTVNNQNRLNVAYHNQMTVARFIKNRIRQTIPNFKTNPQLRIRFFNLLEFKNLQRYFKLFGVTPNPAAALAYLDQRGNLFAPNRVNLKDQHVNGQSLKLWHHTTAIPVAKYNQKLAQQDPQYTRLNQVYNLPIKYYAWKQTDPDFQAHQYGHGMMIGYNSTNYDLTMLAHFFAQIIQIPAILKALQTNAQTWPPLTSGERFQLQRALSPQMMRQFNNHLFYLTCHREAMPSALMHQKDTRRPQETPAWYIRKGWLQTNRFLDIYRLNRRISLKRIEAMTGMQINASDDVNSSQDRLQNYQELTNFIAYNINDINATRKAFEMPVYQDALNLRQLLLKHFPALIYSFDHAKVKRLDAVPQDAKVAPDNLRFTRLTDDSSSAQFIINVVAPYHAIPDVPGVDYKFPDPRVLELLKKRYPSRKLPDHPFDVLDESLKWARRMDHKYHNHGAIETAFLPVYNTYKQLEGCNVNKDLCKKNGESFISKDQKLRDSIGKSRPIGPFVDLKKVMHQYNLNIPYIKAGGAPSSCLVAFGIGGIHGLEIRQSRFKKDVQKYHHDVQIQKDMQKVFGDTSEGAANAKFRQIVTIHGKLIKATPYLAAGSTVHHAAWRKLEPPHLYKYIPQSGRYLIKRRYNYISVGPCQHEDFSGYYPMLISRMGAFWPQDQEHDIYRHLYKERLKLKAQLKKHVKNDPEWDAINTAQKLRKLLLNAGSGAGGANFTNNLRMNNKTISMRIIGQLFAWRIGEAETLAGGRVPSTNTDGMYVMDLDAKTNNKVLFENVKAMLLTIAPSPLARFVSKDANNRVEVENHHGKNVLTEAKGGTLTSWQGPGPSNNLSHPAVVDWVLAHYLAYYPGNPADHPFEKKFAKHYLHQMYQNLFDPKKSFWALKMFAWVTAVSRWKHRFLFLQNFSQKLGQLQQIGYQNLEKINRLFLIKPAHHVSFLKIAAIHPQTPTARFRFNNDLAYQNKIVQTVESGKPTILGNIIKYHDMPDHQNVRIEGHNLKYLAPERLEIIRQQLDLDAYLRVIREKFNSSWSNLEQH